MSLEILGLLLDIIVLGFLGAMIFYSMRLSRSLTEFRAHRQEFDNMIIKLMASIDQAERAIGNLKQVSAKEMDNLNRLVQQSRGLSEELQIINEAGENMAKRLEDLAEKNRKVAQGADLTEPPSQRYKPYKPPRAESVPEKVQPPRSVDDFPSFITRDYAQEQTQPQQTGNAPAPQLQSQAEVDLYNALRGKPAPGRGRAS